MKHCLNKRDSYNAKRSQTNPQSEIKKVFQKERRITSYKLPHDTNERREQDVEERRLSDGRIEPYIEFDFGDH